MKCPHCNVAFNDEQSHKNAYSEYDKDGGWLIDRRECPECGRIILHLIHRKQNDYGKEYTASTVLIRPKTAARICPAEVPDTFSEDFKESCCVLPDSAKASAELSRRCLQNTLREKAATKSKDLADQIEEVIASNILPSYLADDLDAVRNIGNFAAHPIKSQRTGEILPVEPGEAEWNLDVLEALFDFYFVQPAKNEKRKQALNAKLQEAGKPVLK